MPETKSLFNRVAEHYDLLNTIFSLGIDKSWRKRLIEEIKDARFALDVATGTAEVAIEAAKKNGSYVVGLDPSVEMLRLGEKKIISLGLGKKIALSQGFAERLPFKEKTFDAVTIAFGIRNTVDPYESLKEMKRVLKPNGKVGILEFAVPTNFLFSPLYMFYLKNVMPLIGSLLSRKDEYDYLADSIPKFPQRQSFTKLMEKAGFKIERPIELTLGTVIIYIGVKES